MNNEGINNLYPIKRTNPRSARKKPNGFDHWSPEMVEPNQKSSTLAGSDQKGYGSLPGARARPVKVLGENGQISIHGDPESFQETLGTKDLDLARHLAVQVNNASPPDKYDKSWFRNSNFAALHAIAPRDGLEGMLAAQMVALNNHIMAALTRAADPHMTDEIREARENSAAKLIRSYVLLAEVLIKYRQSAARKTAIGQVHVHEGGQAVVAVTERSARESVEETNEKRD